MSEKFENNNELGNWKDLLIKFPFLPPRYLSFKFPEFKRYDLNNWMKKSHVKDVLKRDKWKLRKIWNGKE